MVVFFFSLVIGFVLGLMYSEVKSIESTDQSHLLIDFVIADWTGVGQNETVTPEDSIFEAQFPASKELPNARLGYFPDTVRSLAEMVQKQYGVPSAVTLAQWALESGFGKRNLGASNYFGHTFAATKKYQKSPGFVVRNDVVSVNGILVPGPKRKFTSYKNIAECFDVHGRYLSGMEMYRAAFYTSSAENFVRVIALRYAQDPNYAVKLITIIRRYKLA